MERLVEPVIADLQCEHTGAAATGRRWAAAVVRLRGGAALVSGLLLFVATDVRYRRQRQAGVVGSATFIGSVMLYVWPFLQVPRMNQGASVTRLAVYLMPGAVPFAVSFALLCGALHGLARAIPAARTIRRLLGCGMMLATVSVAMAAWMIPAGNQDFRVAAAGRTVAKGLNELSLGELRALLAETREPLMLVGPHHRRVLEASYQARWMLASLPILAAALGLAVARRGRTVRFLTAFVFLIGYYRYYFLVLHQDEGGVLVSGTVPVWLLVWAPILVLALSSAGELARAAFADSARKVAR
jgi:lipopolysaccharide export LptBFGC system permease protein LptF